jgi:hypothetical protein
MGPMKAPVGVVMRANVGRSKLKCSVLNTSYLRSGLVQRSAAIGVATAGIGTGVLFAAWGISFLWRHKPPLRLRYAFPIRRFTSGKMRPLRSKGQAICTRAAGAA